MKNPEKRVLLEILVPLIKSDELNDDELSTLVRVCLCVAERIEKREAQETKQQ